MDIAVTREISYFKLESLKSRKSLRKIRKIGISATLLARIRRTFLDTIIDNTI